MQDIPKIARLRTAEDPDYGFGEQRLRERMTAYFHQHPRLARANRIMYLAVQGTRMSATSPAIEPARSAATANCSGSMSPRNDEGVA